MNISSSAELGSENFFSVSSDSEESRDRGPEQARFALDGTKNATKKLRIFELEYSSGPGGPVRGACDQQAAGKAALAQEPASGPSTSIQLVRISPLHHSAVKLNARARCNALVRVQLVRPIQPRSTPESAPGVSDECLANRQTCGVEKTWNTSIPHFELDASSGGEDCRRIKKKLDSVIREGDEQPLHDLRFNIDTNLDLSGLLRNNEHFMHFVTDKQKLSASTALPVSGPRKHSPYRPKFPAERSPQPATSLCFAGQ